jgi:hypothetical protein
LFASDIQTGSVYGWERRQSSSAYKWRQDTVVSVIDSEKYAYDYALFEVNDDSEGVRMFFVTV